MYVDDIIGVLHLDDLEVSHHTTCTRLHGIHSVSPPPESGLPDNDPISYTMNCVTTDQDSELQSAKVGGPSHIVH